MLAKWHRGLSLLELVIGLLVGAIVIAGATKIFTGSTKNSNENINASALNQDLRSMMDVMVREIRRAGFVYSDPVSDKAAFLDMLRKNPFAVINVENNGTCLTYMYNKDSSAAVDYSERMGFKMNNDNAFSPPKPVLRMRRGASALACGTNNLGWESITSPEVMITDLKFTLQETALNVEQRLNDPTNPLAVAANCNVNDRCLYLRSVTIRLSGALRKVPAVTQTLIETVRVRNDQYCKVISLTPMRVCEVL